jgi:hypothetical protein
MNLRRKMFLALVVISIIGTVGMWTFSEWILKEGFEEIEIEFIKKLFSGVWTISMISPSSWTHLRPLSLPGMTCMNTWSQETQASLRRCARATVEIPLVQPAE